MRKHCWRRQNVNMSTAFQVHPWLAAPLCSALLYLCQYLDCIVSSLCGQQRGPSFHHYSQVWSLTEFWQSCSAWRDFFGRLDPDEVRPVMVGIGFDVGTVAAAIPQELLAVIKCLLTKCRNSFFLFSSWWPHKY